MVLLALIALALPDALLNQPYSPSATWERVSTRCAMPIPVTRVVGGALPPGLEVSGRGEFAGIPTEPGVYAFTVEVSDGCSRRQEQRQIRVMPAPILVVEAETTEFRCPQGSPPFAGGLVRVSSSAPGRAYSLDILDNGDPAKTGSVWLQATMRDGTIPADGMALEADTLRLSISPAKLAPGNYSARLRVSTWQGTNAPELLFRLRVDSPQSVFLPIVSTPSPIPVHISIAEAPSVQVIAPPRVAHRPPPHFPRYIPKPKPVPKPVVAKSTRGLGRSRVLPFIKVMLPPKKNTEKPADAPKPGDKKPTDKAVEQPSVKVEPKPGTKKETKPPAKPEPKTVAKAETKKEAPPERTKPSAMPPAPAKQ